MAGKSQFLEKQFINRYLRRLTTAVSGSNASTTVILCTLGTGFVAGDIVKLTTAGSYHLVTGSDATHVTVTPALGAAPTTGNIEAWGYAPAAVWVALFTTAPTDTTSGTEVTGGSYARVQITQDDASWVGPSGSPSSTSNSGTVTFPAPSANWGTVRAMALMDASTSGNILFWNLLTTETIINNLDPAPVWPIASLVLTED